MILFHRTDLPRAIEADGSVYQVSATGGTMQNLSEQEDTDTDEEIDSQQDE